MKSTFKKISTAVSRPFKKFLAPETKIVKNGKWYAIPSLAVISLGTILIVLGIFISGIGFNLGLDFTGGRILKVNGIQAAQYAETKTIVSEILKDTYSKSMANKTFFQREDSDGGAIALTARYPDTKERSQTELENLSTAVRDKLAENGIHAEVKPANSISANASSDRLMNVFIAVFTALIGILVYMVIRFRFTSGIAAGVAAIIGLFHDVLVMTALVVIFRIQVNFVFVAAVITVVAYSLNNTLVLLDRVRDKGNDPTNTQTIAQKMDSSIKETFWRTSLTTITTLIPVIILCIFGVDSIREFALPILFGLLAGTYSTICITSSLFVRFENAKAAQEKSKIKN